MENASVFACDLDQLKLIEKLCEFNVINKSPKCNCGSLMSFVKSEESIDKYRLICRFCDRRRSIRSSTWLFKCRLSLERIFKFVSLWSDFIESSVICKYLKISNQTCVNLNKLCYDVVDQAINSCPEPIGGSGCIVEIDESKFGHRKYNVGHPVEGQWVFGGIDRDSGKVFMVPVDKRDSGTLIPLIIKWMKPESTIISDCWSAYRKLEEIGYKHLDVNHSVAFKDPFTGAHTNTIESLWRHAKHRIPQYNRRKSYFSGYLAKFIFIRNAKKSGLDPVAEFFKASKNYKKCVKSRAS